MRAKYWWAMAVAAAALHLGSLWLLWQVSPVMAGAVFCMVTGGHLARGAYLRWQIAKILRTG